MDPLPKMFEWLAVLGIHHAQAAIQYLPPSAGSFDASQQFRVGVCPLNAKFFSCVIMYYPAEILFLMAASVLMLWLRSRRSRLH
jgi:hypothetical protein